MRLCDKRFEMRLPAREKNAAESYAAERGITVSELLRRALRVYLDIPEPLAVEARQCVADLRRRINEMEARAIKGGDATLGTDIARARDDTAALMGR